MVNNIDTRQVLENNMYFPSNVDMNMSTSITSNKNMEHTAVSGIILRKKRLFVILRMQWRKNKYVQITIIKLYICISVNLLYRQAERYNFIDISLIWLNIFMDVTSY